MAKEYNKSNIVKTYYSVIILDDCGDIYEEMEKNPLTHEPFKDLTEAAKCILDMKSSDKELGEEYGRWDYRIGKHEEDDDTDWQSVYKLYKYKGCWKVKLDERW